MNTDKLNLDNLTNISRKDVMSALGLTPSFRDYAWPAMGMLATGLIVGAGVALMFAPKSGAKLRADISEEVRTRLDSLEQRLHTVISKLDTRDQDVDESDREIEIKEKQSKKAA